MTEDELGRLDNALCLVFLRGERPIRDQKIILEKHRCYKRLVLYEPLHKKLFTGRNAAKQVLLVSRTGEISKETPVFDLEAMSKEEVAALILNLKGE